MHKAHVIDGKAIAKKITDELAQTIAQGNFTRQPGLATVLVGDDKASTIYVTNKRKRAEEVGIKSFHFSLDQESTQDEVLALIRDLNNRPEVDAILVQLPLPRHLSEPTIIDAIDPRKDADGIHPLNLGYLFRGDPRVLACTPHGIMKIFQAVGFSVAGKHAVVVGRSTIVGKPIAHLCLQEDATVTLCHSRTNNLASFTRNADIVIAAVGRPRMLTREHFKPGAFVVDVGINRDDNNRICGDVDFANVENHVAFITPVPFGVGPMTIAMLLTNTFANFSSALS